jgi:chromosome partitioning protein
LLKVALEGVKKQYAHIIIDTAPGLNTTLIQALTAADRVIIPLLSDPQALQGLHSIAETIEEVKRYCNPELKVAAVVLTQYTPRATLTKQYETLIKELCEEMKLYFAKAHIRKAIAIQEAQALRKSLYEYAPNSNPAADYIELLKEVKLIK